MAKVSKADDHAQQVVDYLKSHGPSRVNEMDADLSISRQSICNAITYLKRLGEVVVDCPRTRKIATLWKLTDDSDLPESPLAQFTEHHNKKEVNHEDILWMRHYRAQWVKRYTSRGLTPPRL